MKRWRFKENAARDAEAQANNMKGALLRAKIEFGDAEIALLEYLCANPGTFKKKGKSAKVEPAELQSLRQAFEGTGAAYKALVAKALLHYNAALVLSDKAAWAEALINLERGNRGPVDASHAHDMAKRGFVQYGGGGGPELSPFGRELAAVLHDYMEDCP